MNASIPETDCRKYGVCHKNAQRRIGFYLAPTFAMLPFVSAIEPLRAANRYSGKALYSWHVFSDDGADVPACNGMTQSADAPLDDTIPLDLLFICGPHDPEVYDNKTLTNQLKRFARKGVTLGALDTGTYMLARAGLLQNRRCTVHWEDLTAFRQEFPALQVSMELFESDRDRLTCAGGTAALDMMLDLVGAHHGPDLARQSSELLIHTQIRDSDQPQRMDLGLRTGIHDSRLLDCIAIMEANFEQPLLTSEMSSAVGLSIRQIERLFQRHLGVTPIRYYLDIRLNQVRHLLEETDIPLMDIALQTGFSSASHLSQHFRKRFGTTPKQYRISCFRQ